MNSLRSKVFFGVLSGLVLVIAAAEIVSYRQAVSFAEQDLFNSLKRYAVALSEVSELDSNNRFVLPPDWDNQLKIGSDDRAQFFEFMTADDDYLTDSHNLGGDSLPQVGVHQGRKLIDYGNIVLGVYQHHFELVSTNGKALPFKLIVAENTDLISSARHATIKTLLLITPLALIAAFVISFALTAAILSSISRFTNRVQSYNRNDNRSRVDLDNLDKEMKPLAEALNKYIYHLNQHSILESKLLADTAHELRMPLATMRKELDQLRDALPTEGGLKVNADAIDRDLSALQRMTDNMLLLYRIESGNYHPKLEELDLLVEVEPIVRKMNLNDDLSIEIIGDKEKVRCNRTVLNVIVSQLINNVLQHASGSVIYVSWTAKSSKVELHVDDEGRGIPAAERERIFDRHYRFEDYTGTAASSGSGLGLALVRLYANAIDAETICQDSPAGGARFTVVFNSATADTSHNNSSDTVTEPGRDHE